MKYYLIPADYHGKPLFDLSGDEIAAHVFAELEAQLQNNLAGGQSDTPVSRCPNHQTVLERFSAKWYSQSRTKAVTVLDKNPEITKEPEWTGHWAILKYL